MILMTYAERGSIHATIEDFFATGLVDEVLVVNNNAETGTREEVAQTPAREVFESRQGYGWASRRGLAGPPGIPPFWPSRMAPFCRATSASCWPTATSARRSSAPDHPLPDLERRQHGAAAEVGQLGGGQASRGAVQH